MDFELAELDPPDFALLPELLFEEPLRLDAFALLPLLELPVLELRELDPLEDFAFELLLLVELFEDEGLF